ncbi:hypothetical protein [Virgibacillus oceani]|uniref:Uncharacterized protein n=1 Tax=Virgibacillus oceani TaxID=1479511 RepID=A0A917H7S8_9BACI|nr:hypothetical protein [Virgibacillus oceani]GGG70230.1 hypothetical protein GCM10011398_12880 [Virgibacillus oceani]
MLWLYIIVPIAVVFVVALLYDRNAKRNGQSFDTSYNGTKNQREQNVQAQNDTQRMYENNDSFFNY